LHRCVRLFVLPEVNNVSLKFGLYIHIYRLSLVLPTGLKGAVTVNSWCTCLFISTSYCAVVCSVYPRHLCAAFHPQKTIAPKV